MTVIRTTFKASNTTKPMGNIANFLEIEALVINTRKTANMMNAIREYIPVQGRSTAKCVGSPVEVVES